MMQDMARMGRYGDTRMAHVTPGEKIVPTNVLRNRPDLAQGINSALMSQGMDPRRYTVGAQNNSNNPNTGLPEFFSWSDAWDIGKRILSSPAGSAATAKLVTDVVRGKKPDLREALISAAIGGGIGMMSGDYSAGEAFGFGDRSNGEADLDNTNYRLDMSSRNGQVGGQVGGPQGRSGDVLSQALNPRPVSQATGGTRQWNPKLLGYGEIASKLAPGLEKEGSFLGSLLNTKAGEALISGLGAQLLSSLFDKEEVDEGAKRAQRPFGFGDRRVSVNTMRPMANGGTTYPQYFPRRNGGIMPNEGSGKRDDVPAMLMAGEFVLTKDAVKGLGGGNERTGIENAYKMQRKLEGMA
jgi:hypothetical protein